MEMDGDRNWVKILEQHRIKIWRVLMGAINYNPFCRFSGKCVKTDTCLDIVYWSIKYYSLYISKLWKLHNLKLRNNFSTLCNFRYRPPLFRFLLIRLILIRWWLASQFNHAQGHTSWTRPGNMAPRPPLPSDKNQGDNYYHYYFRNQMKNSQNIRSTPDHPTTLHGQRYQLKIHVHTIIK